MKHRGAERDPPGGVPTRRLQNLLPLALTPSARPSRRSAPDSLESRELSLDSPFRFRTPESHPPRARPSLPRRHGRRRGHPRARARVDDAREIALGVRQSVQGARPSPRVRSSIALAQISPRRRTPSRLTPDPSLPRPTSLLHRGVRAGRVRVQLRHPLQPRRAVREPHDAPRRGRRLPRPRPPQDGRGAVPAPALDADAEARERGDARREPPHADGHRRRGRVQRRRRRRLRHHQDQRPGRHALRANPRGAERVHPRRGVGRRRGRAPARGVPRVGRDRRVERGA